MGSFSNINAELVLPQRPKDYLIGTARQMLGLFDRSVERWGLPPQHAARLDAVVGRHNTDMGLQASNVHQRVRLGSALIDVISAMESMQPSRRLYLITLISDRWLTFDRDTRIFLGGMKAAARQLIAHADFDGWIGFVEVQTLDESVRVAGRILLPHIHALAWTGDADIDHRQAQTDMAASGRLESACGVRTADIRPINRGQAANAAAYVAKVALQAKYRKYNPASPSGFILGECRLQPVSAVRQLEVMSSMNFSDVVFTGGDGGPIRTKILDAIRVRGDDQTRPNMDPEFARWAWKAAQKASGKMAAYGGILIDRSDAQLPKSPPIGLALKRKPTSYWYQSWALLNARLDGKWSGSIQPYAAELELLYGSMGKT